MRLFQADGLTDQAQQMTDCDYVMSEYLYSQWAIYRYKDVLAFFVAILTVPYWFKHHYQNYHVFQLYLAVIAVYLLLSYAVRVVVQRYVSGSALARLLRQCNKWQDSAEVKKACKPVINTVDVAATPVPAGAEGGVAESFAVSSYAVSQPGNVPVPNGSLVNYGPESDALMAEMSQVAHPGGPKAMPGAGSLYVPIPLMASDFAPVAANVLESFVDASFRPLQE